MSTETQQAYAGYITGSSFKGRANNGAAYILATATVGGIGHLKGSAGQVVNDFDNESFFDNNVGQMADLLNRDEE